MFDNLQIRQNYNHLEKKTQGRELWKKCTRDLWQQNTFHDDFKNRWTSCKLAHVFSNLFEFARIATKRNAYYTQYSYTPMNEIPKFQTTLQKLF